MNNEHGCAIVVQRGNFIKNEDFIKFKKQVEAETKTFFVTRNSRPGYKIFKCQHDKAYHPCSSTADLIDQERDPKLNQVKCSGSCPTMLIAKTEDDSSIAVKITIYHPHEILSKFVSLTADIRNKIFIKLSLGVVHNDNDIYGDISNDNDTIIQYRYRIALKKI